MKNVELVKQNKNYAIGNIGSFDELEEYAFFHPSLGKQIQGKVFLGEKLGMSSMEVSFQVLKSGQCIPFDHMHRENEEVYVILKGRGEFAIDNEVTSVEEGSVIRIAPEAKRRWANCSEEDLILMVIQAASQSLNHFNVTDGYAE